MYKHYVLCEDWGQISCTSHPLFLIDLMHNLDKIEEITGKELYQVRSISTLGPPRIFDEYTWFDFDKQTLKHPYDVFRERIEKKLESE